MFVSIFLFLLATFLSESNAAGPMYPGTKWCGPGNTAKNYSDLGRFVEEDKCCRDHDNCDDVLPPNEHNPERGLKNEGPWTKLHCRCDKAFKDCLLTVNSTVSHLIGSLYFKVQLHCFKEEFPIENCTELHSSCCINRGCLLYSVNKEKPKEWQFFTMPSFHDPQQYDVFDV